MHAHTDVFISQLPDVTLTQENLQTSFKSIAIYMGQTSTVIKVTQTADEVINLFLDYTVSQAI